MKHLTQYWKRIPRGLRICINLLGIILCLLALYTYLDAPTFSVETLFRRYEKANMVGPCEILGDVRLEAGFDSYQRMLIAEDDSGVAFFCYDHVDGDDPKLIYRDKTGDITILGSPYPKESRLRTIKCQYPIFVFDDFPDAVRAEMDITLTAEYNGQSFEKTYSLTAYRSSPGYFQFVLGFTDPGGIGIEGYAIQTVALLSGYDGKYYQDLSFPVTLQLYDDSGRLICERSLEIVSVMTQAHQARGE